MGVLREFVRQSYIAANYYSAKTMLLSLHVEIQRSRGFRKIVTVVGVWKHAVGGQLRIQTGGQGAQNNILFKYKKNVGACPWTPLEHPDPLKVLDPPPGLWGLDNPVCISMFMEY